MNYVKNNVRLIMLAMASVFISAGVYAGPKVIGESKTTTKARQAIEQAAPDDWYTYAQSAEKCLRKKVNLKEAKTWLERSIEIKETPYNLAVMGDYYSKNKLPEKALEYYVKSLRVGLEQDIAYKDVITHEKMMKARGIVLKASR